MAIISPQIKANAHIEPVTWTQVRASVLKVNPILGQIIDAIDPGPEYLLFRARYPFRSDVVSVGELMLPDQNGTISPIHSPKVSESIRSHLSYSTIAMGIWLNTSGEVYVEMDDRVVPIMVFHPGQVFGLWEVLDKPAIAFSQRIWNMSAGSRSLFMLPKISDSLSLSRLEKHFQIRSLHPPRSIFEHSRLFSQIVNCPKSNCEWMSEIIFFSDKWFEKDDRDQDWINFHYFLLKNEWTRSIFWRNKVTFDLIGQTFAIAQANKNLKASPFLIDVVMHLVSLAIGSVPGFKPVEANEYCAPVKEIQEAIVDIYGLKQYIPTLMNPSNFSGDDPNEAIYSSLQTPTLLASSPMVRRPHSVLDDLRWVKALLEELLQSLQHQNLPIFNLLRGVEFDFFHSEADGNHGINSSRQLLEEDPRFFSNEITDDRQLCENSSFLRGCVRIRRRKRSTP